MTIISSEIKLYKPTNNNDFSYNGGRISSIPITNSIFPNAQNSERIAGSIKYRKIFYKVDNADNLTLANSKFFILTNTEGDDDITAFVGDFSDTQANIGNPRLYGCAKLASNLNPGSSTITVIQENTNTLFVNNDIAILTNKTNLTDEDGNYELFYISNVVKNQNTVTLTIDNNTNTFGYLQNDRLASVIDLGEIKTVANNLNNTSINGVFNIDDLILNNIGAIDQDISLEFVSPTSFNIFSDLLGLLGTGTVSTDFSVENPNFPGYNYFEIPASCFSGNYLALDLVSFTISPAAKGIWLKRNIPANCGVKENNTFITGLIGESD
jgi:hypothetical protein